MRVLRLIARIWTILLGSTALVFLLALLVRSAAPLTPWTDLPALTNSLPADGASDVGPRSSITLTFTQPMNWRSVERALQIIPPTPGRIVWRNNGRVVEFTPTSPLVSDTTYTISIDSVAENSWWRPLVTPVQLHFHTAQAPKVIAALPDSSGVDADTPIALVFSQPMVSPDAVGQPTTLPQLLITPPFTSTARWITVDTLLLQPDTPLLPDT
ncbi:MAG: Ig-like domain-containing protein, partial [Chloroflexales bacterium]|nr:Ig-like domain-containing protein [Chloroflexales bacterium]